MRKLVQKFIKWLYITYVDPDINSLIKEQLALAKPFSLSGKNENDELKYLREYDLLYNNSFLKELLHGLTYSQKEETLEKAETEKQFLCGKLSIHGIGTVSEALNTYHLRYQEKIAPKKPYNRFDILGAPRQ